MRQIKIGNITETVVERADYPPEKLKAILGKETVAVLGYGVQGRGQSLNMKDNGVNVIIGQREKAARAGTWPQQDGWVPGKTLFSARRGRPARHHHPVPALRRRPEGAVAEAQAAPDRRQGPLFLARLQHRLQRPDRRRPAQGHRRDPGRPEGLRHHRAPAVPGGQGHQRQLRHPPGRHRPGAATAAWRCGIAIGSGYLFETTFQKEVFSDLTGERGVLMGAIYGLWLAQYEVLREHGHSPVGSVQRDGRGGDAEPLSADRRERHGLDVRQLLDDRPARRPRLVQEVPRRLQAGVRGAVPEGGRRRGDAARAGGQQPARLPRSSWRRS